MPSELTDWRNNPERLRRRALVRTTRPADAPDMLDGSVTAGPASEAGEAYRRGLDTELRTREQMVADRSVTLAEAMRGEGQPEAGDEDEGTTAQVVRAPLVGVAAAVDETAQTAQSAWNWLVGEDAESQQALTNFVGLMGGQPTHPAARAFSAITQFSTLFVPGLGAARAAGLAGTGVKSAAGAATAGAVTDFVAFDPFEERLSTLLNQVPGLNRIVPDWMASHDPAEGELTNRAKNVLEGLGIGFAVDGLVRGLTRYRSIKARGRPERAQQASQVGYDAVDPEEQARAAAKAEGEAAVEVGYDKFPEEERLNLEGLGNRLLDITNDLEELDGAEVIPLLARPNESEMLVRRGLDVALLRDHLMSRKDEDWVGFANMVLQERSFSVRNRHATMDPFSSPARERRRSAETIRALARNSMDPAVSADARLAARGLLLEQLDAEGIAALYDVPLRTWVQHVEMRPPDQSLGIVQEGTRHGMAAQILGEDTVAEGSVTTLREQPYWGVPRAIVDPLDLAARRSRTPAGTDELSMQAGKPIDDFYALGSRVDDTGRGRAVWMAQGRGGPQSLGTYGEDVSNAVLRSRVERLMDPAVDPDELARIRETPVGRKGVVTEGAPAEQARLAARMAKQSLGQLLEDTVSLPRDVARQIFEESREILDPDKVRGIDFDKPEQLDLMLTMGQQVVRMAGAIKQGEVETIRGFAEAVFRYQQWGRLVAGTPGGAGRMGSLADGIMRSKEWALEAVGGEERILAMAAAIDETETFGEAMSLTKHWAETARGIDGEGKTAGVIRDLNTIRMSSLLSDPGTHVMNAVGNMVPVLWQVPENYLAAAFRGDRGKRLAAANMHAAGMAHGLRTAWRLAMRDAGINFGSAAQRSRHWKRAKEENLHHMLSDFTRRPKADILTGQYTPEAMAHLRSAEPRSWMPERVSEALRKVVRAPFYALSATDVFFKGVHFHAELFRQAALRNREAGFRGRGFYRRVQEEAVKPDRRSNEYKRALQFAEEQTFTNEPGKFSQHIIDGMNWGGGVGRLLADIPFMRTPINLVSWTAQRLPGTNLLFKRSRRALSGADGEDEQARELSRMILGGVALTTFGALAERGAITGSWGGNRWTRLQDPKNSMRVGDEWIRLDRLPWVGVAAGMAADAMQMVHAAQTDEELGLAEGLWGLTMITLGRMLEQMPTTDLANIFELGMEVSEGGDKASVILGRHAVGIASSFGPYTGMQRALGRTFATEGQAWDSRPGGGVADPHESTLEYWQELGEELWMKGFPLFEALREDGAHPRFDIYGEPTPHRGPEPVVYPDERVSEVDRVEFPKIGTFMLSALAPVAARDDDLTKALRVHASQLDLDVPKRTIPVRGSDIVVEMTGEEYAWVSEVSGKTFFKQGTRLVRSAGWQSMNTDQRAAALQDVRDESVRMARQLAIRQFPDLKDRSLNAKMAQRRREQGE